MAQLCEKQADQWNSSNSFSYLKLLITREVTSIYIEFELHGAVDKEDYRLFTA